MEIHLPNCLIWVVLLTILTIPSTKGDLKDEEKKFLEFYGNESSQIHWMTAKSTTNTSSQSLLYIVKGAHEARFKNVAGPSTDNEVGSQKFSKEPIVRNPNLMLATCLKFQTEEYKAIQKLIDVIMYNTEGSNYFYITKGLGPACVYYVKPVGFRTFILDKHVCNIDVLQSRYIHYLQPKTEEDDV